MCEVKNTNISGPSFLALLSGTTIFFKHLPFQYRSPCRIKMIVKTQNHWHHHSKTETRAKEDPKTSIWRRNLINVHYIYTDKVGWMIRSISLRNTSTASKLEHFHYAKYIAIVVVIFVTSCFSERWRCPHCWSEKHLSLLRWYKIERNMVAAFPRCCFTLLT